MQPNFRRKPPKNTLFQEKHGARCARVEARFRSATRTRCRALSARKQRVFSCFLMMCGWCLRSRRELRWCVDGVRCSARRADREQIFFRRANENEARWCSPRGSAARVIREVMTCAWRGARVVCRGCRALVGESRVIEGTVCRVVTRLVCREME